MNYGSVRGSYENIKKDDQRSTMMNQNRYNEPNQNLSSIHHDYLPTKNYDRPRSREIMKNYPPPQGYGMPQFVPMYMPMPMPMQQYGGYGNYGGYGYPYPYGPNMPMFQQPFNYEREYNKQDDLDLSEIKHNDKYSPKKPTKYKSAEQIINEFKSQTLPKLRLKRLIKLQAVMRGYYVRRFKFPIIKRRRKMFREIGLKKLEEFLEDRIIPDIVLEVVAMNKHERDYTLYSHKLRDQIEIVDTLVNRIVREMARDAVRDTTNNLAQEFLRIKKGEPLEVDLNPFSLCSKDVLHNYVTKNAENIARECINEVVVEYLMEQQMNFLLKTKYIPNLAREAAMDAVHEVAIEEIINDKVDEMIRDVAPAMIEVQYEELVTEATDAELEKAAKNHLRRLILDVLVDNLRTMIIAKSEKEDVADNAMKAKNYNYLDDGDIVLDEK